MRAIVVILKVLDKYGVSISKQDYTLTSSRAPSLNLKFKSLQILMEELVCCS
jgi:hypothetical protein